MADSEAVKSALMPLLEESTPYVLVNNAGFRKDAIMAMMNKEEWEGVLSVSLNGFFLVTKLVVTNMLRKRKGRIINIVSTSGQSGMAGQVNYSAAKAGLIGATKALAAEVAKRNILVNAVSPGFIETEMTKDLPKEQITAHDTAGKVRQGVGSCGCGELSGIGQSNLHYGTGISPSMAASTCRGPIRLPAYNGASLSSRLLDIALYACVVHLLVITILFWLPNRPGCADV